MHLDSGITPECKFRPHHSLAVDSESQVPCLRTGDKDGGPFSRGDDETVGIKHKAQCIWPSVSTNGLSSSFFLLFLLPLPLSSAYYCGGCTVPINPQIFYFFFPNPPSPFPSCFSVHMSDWGGVLDSATSWPGSWPILSAHEGPGLSTCCPRPSDKHAHPSFSLWDNLGVLISSLPCKWMTGCSPIKLQGGDPSHSEIRSLEWSSEPHKEPSPGPLWLCWKEEALGQQLFRAGTFSLPLSGSKSPDSTSRNLSTRCVPLHEQQTACKCKRLENPKTPINKQTSYISFGRSIQQKTRWPPLERTRLI